MVSTRKLGKNGPQVASIGLGCMGMSEYYGPADDVESVKVLKRAIELESTFWDTADQYGVGKNEELLSKVLKTDREKVFVCTKFGIVRGPNGERLGICGKPEYVKEACNKSLKRLGIDCIDLYYQHRIDKEVPIEDTVRAMAELVKEGKVKYLGLSECSAEILRRAHAVHPISAIQMEYSPWSLDIEANGVLEAARELGVAIVAYSPLGRGFLSGRFKSIDDFDQDDVRRAMPRKMSHAPAIFARNAGLYSKFAGENFAKNIELVNKFTEYAQKKGCTPSQLVLAWVLAQGEDFVVIPGTRNIKYLEENVGASKVTITPQEDKAIREIIASIKVEGQRYPENMLRDVNKS